MEKVKIISKHTEMVCGSKVVNAKCDCGCEVRLSEYPGDQQPGFFNEPTRRAVHVTSNPQCVHSHTTEYVEGREKMAEHWTSQLSLWVYL